MKNVFAIGTAILLIAVAMVKTTRNATRMESIGIPIDGMISVTRSAIVINMVYGNV